MECCIDEARSDRWNDEAGVLHLAVEIAALDGDGVDASRRPGRIAARRRRNGGGAQRRRRLRAGASGKAGPSRC